MKSLDKVRKEYGPVTVTLLKKQCSIIKVDYKTINFSKHNWYQNHTWTKKQEDRFRKYFINYLYGSLKRTREIAKFAYIAYKSKRRLEIVWKYWNLDYGWTRSDYETEKR